MSRWGGVFQLRATALEECTALIISVPSTPNIVHLSCGCPPTAEAPGLTPPHA